LSKRGRGFVKGGLRLPTYSNGKGVFLRAENIGICAAIATARLPCHRFKVREGCGLPYMKPVRYDLY
jgi:hypothetical protein